jgi:hypothetical protein
MAEIDSLLQTVMFTIYGNQYESREEHLLLTMFQVRLVSLMNLSKLTCFLVCLDIPIRQHARLFLPPPRQHPRFPNDDHIHSKRTRSELPQVRAC